MTRVAILGCGTVGRRVADLLINSDSVRERLGPIEISHIMVRDAKKDRGLPRSLFTSSIDELIDHAPEVAIELLGGLDPARSHIETLLGRGIPVVTANKSVIARFGPELQACAAQNAASLRYEASVCAGLPILAALESLRGDRVRSIRGVINGSCNFILTRMRRDGHSLEDAVELARTHGLVEPDPSADLSGRDAAEKLCILAGLIGRRLHPDDVETIPLQALDRGDLVKAREWGYVIRHVAELDEHSARVGPVVLPLKHPLASVQDENNSVVIDAELAGPIVLHGRGAGPDATASAILGDLCALVGRRSRLTALRQWPKRPDQSDRPHYLRFRLNDSLGPTELLKGLKAGGINAAQLEIHQRRASLVTSPCDSDRIVKAVASIGRTEHLHIAPCLDPVA